MLEQSAVHMTEEEIDAYYRQQQEENVVYYSVDETDYMFQTGEIPPS